MTNPINRELEFYIQGAQSARQMTAGSNRVARSFFKQAIAEKDDFARAHGYLSYSLLLAYLHGWNRADIAEDNDVTLDKVLHHANLACTHGPDDYENHWSLAAACVYSRNFTNAMDSFGTALDLAKTQAIPFNLSCLKVEKADALIFSGNRTAIESAIEIIEGEMQGSDFPKTHFWALGWAYYELGAFDQAKEETYALMSLKALLQFPGPMRSSKKTSWRATPRSAGRKPPTWSARSSAATSPQAIALPTIPSGPMATTSVGRAGCGTSGRAGCPPDVALSASVTRSRLRHKFPYG